MNFNRDGAMRHRITKSNVNYWPNRHGVGHPIPKEQGGYHEYVRLNVKLDVADGGDAGIRRRWKVLSRG